MSELPAYARLLRAIRSARHWTQGDLAHELCVSRVTVSNWERGRTEPHPGWLARIRGLMPSSAGVVEAHLDALAMLEHDASSGRLSRADADRLKSALVEALSALSSVQGRRRAA